MNFATRQFTELSNKLRKELREGLEQIARQLQAQNDLAQARHNAELKATPIAQQVYLTDSTIDRIRRRSEDEFKHEKFKDRLEIGTLAIILAYTIIAAYQWIALQTQNLNQSAANTSQSATAALSLAYARNQIRTDQRAWVVFDTNYLDSKVQDRAGVDIRVPIQIINLGKTPARNISGVVAVDELETTDDPNFDYSHRPKGHIDDSILYPGYPATSVVSPPLRRHKGKTLKVHGRITYEDAFHVHHWLTFCHAVSASEIARTPKCVANNDTDQNLE